MKKVLIVCTTDSMIWNFLIPHIQMLNSNGFDVECACSVTGDFFSKLETDYGIKMHEIEFSRSPYKVSNLRAFSALNNLVKINNYDIIFCHEPVGGVIGRIVGKINNCYVIYMAHGFHFYNGAPKINFIYYVVEKVMSKFTDVLITINKEDFLASKKFQANHNVLLPGIGVDTSEFSEKTETSNIREEIGIGEKDILILSVGELIKRKNHQVVIKALKVLNNSKVHYVIAGTGELKSELTTLVEDNNLTKQVHMIGYRTDINQLCCSSDIFVMPSLQEGLSVALMEAMACSKPVIASRIRGNVDLIDENKGGFLVDTCDVDSYVKALDMLIHSPIQCRTFGEYNNKKIKEYDIKNVKASLLEIFLNISEVSIKNDNT